jgi:hypothetical protein
MTVQLSNVKPDFDDIRAQLQALLDQYPSWRDRLVSSTGQVLLDFVAGVGAYDQASIERALEESFNDTAVADSSIYTIARLLGVRVRRKVAAQALVRLVKPAGLVGSYYLPPFSNFRLDGKNFMNAAGPVVMSPAEPWADVVLHECYEVNENFSADGSPFQVYEAGPSDFSAADQFVRVLVDGSEWSKNGDGLWRLTLNQSAYFESTLPDGRIEVRFGNGIYGRIPANGGTVSIRHYVTTGTVANNFATNLECRGVTDPTLVGATISSIHSGEDVGDIEEYRYVVPRQAGAGGRAVTRDDCRSKVLEYPGVIDAFVAGEKELGEGNPAFQNVIGFVIVTQPGVVKDSAWVTSFQLWFEQYQIFRCHLLDIPAIPVAINLTMALVIDPKYSSTQAQNSVTVAVTEFFRPKAGVIGKDFYLYDLGAVIKALPEIKHVTITVPTTDTVVSHEQYAVLGTLTISSIVYG